MRNSLVILVLCLIAVLTLAPASTASAEPVRLDSGWELVTDPGAAFQVSSLPASGWRPAKVGLSWNAQFSDLRDYVGVAWYRTRFTVPPSKVAQRVLLRFGAVDYQADVFVNGEPSGSHEGAYTPFTLDVTDRVKAGANELVVRVVDPPAAGRGRDPRFPQFNYDELPRGKQNWYIQNGGLWQPVWLDVRPALYIDAVRVSSAVSGAIDVDAELVGEAPKRPVFAEDRGAGRARGRWLPPCPRPRSRQRASCASRGRYPRPGCGRLPARRSIPSRRRCPGRSAIGSRIGSGFASSSRATAASTSMESRST